LGRELKSKNARELTPVTPEKVLELIPRIHNLSECRPANPADDTLKEFMGSDWLLTT
jgi:hypothetical protein